MEEKTLRRSKNDRVIGGVIGGLAEYFNIDSTLLRLVYIFLCFVSIKGALLLYIILYIVIPEEKRETTSQKENGRLLLGIILILLGTVLFLNELYHFLTYAMLWPLLLIILGFYLLIKGLEEGQNENR